MRSRTRKTVYRRFWKWGLVFLIVLPIPAAAADVYLTIGGGWYQPNYDILSLGNRLFGPGQGKEWMDIAGLRRVSGSFWYTAGGGIRFWRFMGLEAGYAAWTHAERTQMRLVLADVDHTFEDRTVYFGLTLTGWKGRILPGIGLGVARHTLTVQIRPVDFPEIQRISTLHQNGFYGWAGVHLRLYGGVGVFFGMRYDGAAPATHWRVWGALRIRLWGTG